MFDPMTTVPTNDEQVEVCLKHSRSELLWRPMLGLYQVKRAQGDGLLAAYEKALLASLPQERLNESEQHDKR